MHLADGFSEGDQKVWPLVFEDGDTLDRQRPPLLRWPSGIAFDSKVTEGYYLDICADAEMYQLSIMRDKTQPRQVYVAIHTKLHVLKAVLSVVVSHSQLKFIERSQFEVPDRKTMEVLLAMLNVLPGHIAVRGYDPFYL